MLVGAVVRPSVLSWGKRDLWSTQRPMEKPIVSCLQQSRGLRDFVTTRAKEWDLPIPHPSFHKTVWYGSFHVCVSQLGQAVPRKVTECCVCQGNLLMGVQCLRSECL